MKDNTNQTYETMVSTLKDILKEKRISFADLAKRMQVPERKVYRLFSSGNISIAEFDKMCRAIRLSYPAFVQLVFDKKDISFSLTLEQEKFFASDLQTYAFFIHLLRRHSLQSIKAEHKIDDIKVYKYLRKLEKLGLLTVKKDNDFSLLTDGTFINWINGGPLATLLGKDLAERTHRFIRENAKKTELHYYSRIGYLMSEETLANFAKDLDTLSETYIKRARQDIVSIPRDRLKPCSWIVGCAPFDIIEEIKL